MEGGGEVAPLLEGCEIKCSGDDAVNVGGAGGRGGAEGCVAGASLEFPPLSTTPPC